MNLLKNKKSKIIIALDHLNTGHIISLTKKISPNIFKLKVGYITLLNNGTKIITMLRKLGFDIFLDLKFCDIPSVVSKSVSLISKLELWMITVHSMGGADLIRKTKETLKKYHKPPLLIAVTTLTSLNNNDLCSIGIYEGILNYTLKLADLAYLNGADGVVCSILEAKEIRSRYGPNFLIITPGITINDTLEEDQKRTAKISKKYLDIVDYIVMGRSITKSENPKKTLSEIMHRYFN